MNTRNVVNRRKEMNRGVLGLVGLLTIIFGLILVFLQSEGNEVSRIDERANEYHLTISEKSLDLLRVIDNTKLWFLENEIHDQSGVDVNEQKSGLEFAVTNVAKRDNISAFGLIVKNVVSDILSIQANFNEAKFSSLIESFSEESRKFQIELANEDSFDVYSYRQFENMLSPLISVTHQLQTQHNNAYRELQAEKESYERTSRTQLLGVVVVLVMFGLMGVFRLLRYVGNALTSLEINQDDIRENETNLARALAIAQVGTWKLDIASRKFTCSEGMFRIFDISRDEYNGTSKIFESVVHPDDLHIVKEAMTTVEKTGEGVSLDFRLLRKDGTIVIVHSENEVLKNIESEVTAIVGTVWDVSERHAIEEQLQRLQKIMLRTEEMAQIGSWEWDFKTNNVVWSPEMYRQLGFDPLTTTPSLELAMKAIHPDDLERVLKFSKESLDENTGRSIECRMIRENGEIFHVLSEGTIIRDAEGNPIARHGFFQEITERKQAEEKIEQSRARFEAMFESIPDAIVYAGPDRKIRLINEAVTQVFGYDESELIGKQTSILYASPDDFEEQGRKRFSVNTNIDTTDETNIVPYKVSYRCKNGKEFMGETVGTTVRSSSGEILGFLGVIRDVSERSRVDAILRSLAAGSAGQEFESFLSDALEGLTEVYDCCYAFIGQITPDGEHVRTLTVRANGELVENFQYLLAGTPCQDIVNQKKEFISRDVSKIYADDQMLVDMGIESYFGTPLIGADGTIIGLLVIMDTEPMALDEWTESVLGVFAARVAVELERDIANRELQHHRENLEELVEARTQQLKDAQDDLVRNERLATLGQLTATVSHELRNPLGAMRPSLYMIDRRSDKSDKSIQKALERIDRNIDRCDRIIDELLDFTRITALDLHVTRIDEWLESVIDEQNIPKDIIIEKNLSMKGIDLMVDSSRLRRVIINVIDNACHAIMDKAEELTDPEATKIYFSSRVSEERVEITVADTGSGIAEGVIDRIFEPLFSTKGFGVGLGMPTVKQIMEQHYGGIEIDSEEGKGTTVTLWLPKSVVVGKVDEVVPSALVRKNLS